MFPLSNTASPTENKKSLVLTHMTIPKKEDSIPDKKIEKVCIHHMDEISLRQTIENLRSILYQSVNDNSFTNPSVIAISQELDEYIVRFQQLTSPVKAKETIQ